MKPRSLAALNLVVAILTIVWLILLLMSELSTPPSATLAGRIAAIEDHPALFALNYANAGLLTLACVALLGGYYVYCREDNPVWATIAVVFVPIYGVCNVVVYLSQIFVMPQLLDIYHNPGTAVIGETWLRLALHTWPGSAAGFINILAYAILGIPSIIFGLLLARGPYGSRLGGLLFAVSGLLSIGALAGLATGETLLSLMSPASGFVFLLGLLFLSAHLLRLQSHDPHRPAPAY